MVAVNNHERQGTIWKRVRRLAKRALGRPETSQLRYDRLFRQLRAGDVAIDCGANVGLYAALMAEGGATVHAFEPNPDAYAALCARTAGMANVHCYNQAVSVAPSTIRLYLHRQAAEDPVKWSVGSSMLAYKSNVSETDFVEVEAVDLAAFIRDVGPVKVLKMDIEGAEVEVINHLIDQGCFDLIDDMLVETHDERVPELREPMAALRARIAAEGLKQIDLGWH